MAAISSITKRVSRIKRVRRANVVYYNYAEDVTKFP